MEKRTDRSLLGEYLTFQIKERGLSIVPSKKWPFELHRLGESVGDNAAFRVVNDPDGSPVMLLAVFGKPDHAGERRPHVYMLDELSTMLIEGFDLPEDDQSLDNS